MADALKPHCTTVRGSQWAQSSMGGATGPIANSNPVLAIKRNIFHYFIFLLPSRLGESCVFERLGQQGQKKNQSNIIMAGVGMAGN